MDPPDDAVRLFLIRHGTTLWNSQNRFIGTTDLPLDETGLQQANLLAARLVDEPPDIIYSSTQTRAGETAEILAKSCNLEPIRDARLREMDFGILEGMTVNEINRSFPAEFESWTSGNHVPELKMETTENLLGRSDSFLKQIWKKHRGKTILVVSHAAIMHALIFLALSLPYKKNWHFFMYNGSISELWLQEQSSVLVRLNDTYHLKDL